MKTVKVFQSGNSQAVRIPKSYQVKDVELCINQLGSSIILSPKKDLWKNFQYSIDNFSDDLFETGREEPKMQERESF